MSSETKSAGGFGHAEPFAPERGEVGERELLALLDLRCSCEQERSPLLPTLSEHLLEVGVGTVAVLKPEEDQPGRPIRAGLAVCVGRDDDDDGWFG